MDTQTSTKISLRAIEKAQLPWNKHIPFKVQVNIQEQGINYMQITPQATAGYFIPKLKVIHNPSVGAHVYNFSYVPTEQGVIHYTISVAASTNQTNLAASDSGSFTLNSNLIRTPISSGYMGYQLGMYFLIVLFVTAGLFGIKKALYYVRDKLIPKLVHQQANKGV